MILSLYWSEPISKEKLSIFMIWLLNRNSIVPKSAEKKIGKKIRVIKLNTKEFFLLKTAKYKAIRLPQ